MKTKLTTLLAVVVFLLACSSRNDSEMNVTPEATGAIHRNHEVKPTELVLNNGVKWKADSTTLINVSLIKAIVSNGKKEQPGNHYKTASALQDGLNKLVRECKMKGPDHDALHHWLEPLLEKTKQYEKASSEKSAGAILTEIEEHVNLFTQYFE